MKNLPVLPLCVACLGVGLMVPLFAKPAESLKKSPVADLVAEANAQIEDLGEWTASETEYATRKDDIRRAAGVLAVLGQAIHEHPEAKSQKVAGLALRDFGLELVETKNHQGAMNSIRNIRAAMKGEDPSGERKKRAWKDLISMDDLMHVVNTRNSRVRRAARRSRDPEGDARHAQTIAILTLAMADQAEDYLAEDEEIAEWKKYAMDFHQGMTDLAAAFKAKDKAAVQKHLTFATKACNDCHAKFRDAE